MALGSHAQPLGDVRIPPVFPSSYEDTNKWFLRQHHCREDPPNRKGQQDKVTARMLNLRAIDFPGLAIRNWMYF